MSTVVKTQLHLTTMIARNIYTDLQPLQRYLLIQLSTFGDHEGSSIYPSLNTLADLTGMSRSTVQKHLGVLVEHGYVEKKSGGVVNGQNVNSRYNLNLNRLGLTTPENVIEFPQPTQPTQPDHFNDGIDHTKSLTKSMKERLDRIRSARN